MSVSRWPATPGSAGDITECCTAPATCSTIANTAGFCEAGKKLDSSKASNSCKASACDKTKAEDIAACCSAGNRARCDTVPGLITDKKFACPVDKVYNAANHDHECLALACDSGSAGDITECCTAPATCSTIANTAGFCRSRQALRQQQGQQLL